MWSEVGKRNKDDLHIGKELLKVNSNSVSLEKITCRYIYNSFMNCKQTKNVNKNTCEYRLIDIQLYLDSFQANKMYIASQKCMGI